MDEEYGFEMPNGYWHHKSVADFRSEAHAQGWAAACGFKFMGRFPKPDATNAPGSASWCETQGDNY